MKSNRNGKTAGSSTAGRALQVLHAEVTACARCERLRTYCADVAVTKRRSFASEEYWGKPVPAWGDPRARLWIIGLAPAAHGANRTGRIFTGDRSGDFLFAALHRVGYANQPTSVHRDDGLFLRDCYISATARCAPPDNKPSPIEVANCSGYLDSEWRLLRNKRVILALGGIAWETALALASRNACALSQPKPKFAHGAVVQLCQGLHLVGSYHVSQQNTFTGRLTNAMFDAVLKRCGQLSENGPMSS
jgi:uracil-DNA glycosylase family 4